MKKVTITQDQAEAIEEAIGDVLHDEGYPPSATFLRNRLIEAGCDKKLAESILASACSLQEDIEVLSQDISSETVDVVYDGTQRLVSRLERTFNVRRVGTRGRPLKPRPYPWSIEWRAR